ncbi:MAG: hypothetical protein ACLTYN_11705 [Dysosmobacter welbionis]
MREAGSNFGRLAVDLLCGVLIGAGAILPGVSAGCWRWCSTSTVLYGGADHPRRPSPTLAVVSAHRLGCAIGFLALKGIAAAIDVSSTVTTWSSSA